MTAGYFRGWIGSALDALHRSDDGVPCPAARHLPRRHTAAVRWWIVALVIALVNWVQTARVIYTETSSLAEREFIDAERTHRRRHRAHPVPPYPAASAADDHRLGYARHLDDRAAGGDAQPCLGIGVQPPTASWGNIIFENQTYFQAAPWLVFFPGAAILALALAFNLVGDALRDVLDPTQRGRA